MKHKKIARVPGVFLTLLAMFAAATAQQPSASPSPVIDAGDNAGDYTVVSSFEVGYRGLQVVGDLNKYQSDLNYKAGPRLFDSSVFLKSQEGKGGLFESLLVTSTGWGADPSKNLRFSIEQPKYYRFDGTYRRFKYFRFVNNLANPNWIFNPTTFNVPPNPVTGEHGYDTRTEMGDFDLTLLPKNRTIRFSLGFSPERYHGPAYTNYHVGGDEFNFLSNLRTKANDFRIGADGTVGPIDFSFLQGFRRFRDESFVHIGPNPGINLNPASASLTRFDRIEPDRGTVDFTRFSAHSFIKQRLDITAQITYSKSNSHFSWVETFSGLNWNPRISGWPPGPLAATPNILNFGQHETNGDTSRPNTIGDFGATFFATNKLKISDTFRIEDFDINGDAVFGDFFSITRGSGSSLRTDTISFRNLDAHTLVKYRKYQNTVEGDYQFNPRYTFHIGYRYGHRRIQQAFEGFNLGSNGSVSSPPARSSSNDVETNNTHSILGGFRARPAHNWTIYFDAEHGTADNVFSRIGNYDYTNIRAKSRYAPNQRLAFNLAFISRDNANPSEIAGVSLSDFGVNTKSRVFTSSVDWTPNSKVTINAGYNYNWLNSDAVIDYFFNSIQHPNGHTLYFVRNNFFFIDTTARLTPRLSLFTSYRINKDNGQGNRVQDPIGTPGVLINSYPMSYQSPEGRLAFKINRHVDWNVGYQYYNYNESPLVGPRPQNYHAHMPYTSLRVYIGRKD
jgi:hypothetical protein